VSPESQGGVALRIRKAVFIMKPLGIALVILGVLALVYGGISYTRQKTVLEIGSFKATATEHKNIPLSPIVGGIALLAGVVLVLAPGRRPA
jgi:uncharacterized membrane protein YidH (DUF202 family)